MSIRLEKVNVKKIRSVAKIIGTAIKVVGAMVMTLYKGPIIDFIKSGGATHHGTTAEPADNNWVTGTIMLLGSIFGWSSFFILQVSRNIYCLLNEKSWLNYLIIYELILVMVSGSVLHIEEVPGRALSYSLDMFPGNGARYRSVPCHGPWPKCLESRLGLKASCCNLLCKCPNKTKYNEYRNEKEILTFYLLLYKPFCQPWSWCTWKVLVKQNKQTHETQVLNL